jgi:hypothetical protein
VNAPLDLQRVASEFAIAATTTTTTEVCARAARRAGQAAEAGRDRDDARGWAWICGLWVVVLVVDVVTGQSACSSRVQGACEGGDGQGKTIDIFKRVRKTRELMIGRERRQDKGRARSQWRKTPAGKRLRAGPSTR